MVQHLKHLIESLPVCVMRTDLDGCLLAANDSALQLLGVTEHAKVLTKSLSDRISAEHAEDWRAFLQRTWSEGAGSIETELIDFNGAHRILLIKSVAQPTHADGIQSVILTAQDLASRRRLERALNDHQACATTIAALRVEVLQSNAERERLGALLNASQGDSERSSKADEAVADTLKQHLEELQQSFAAKEQELRNALDAKTQELRDALDAKDRELQRALAQREQELQQTFAAREEELRQALAGTEQEWQKRGDELTARIAAQDAECQRLAHVLEERAGENQRLSEVAEARDAEHKAASETLKSRIAELERSVIASQQEWQNRCDALTARLADETSQQATVSGALEQRTAEHQRLAAELEQREAEHRQLAAMLEQQVSDRQAAADALQQQLQETERSLKRAEQDWQQRSDDLTAELAELAAARLQLTNALAQREAENQAAVHALQERIETLEGSLSAKETDWNKEGETLTASLAEAAAERQRLSALVEEYAADHRAAGGALQQRIDELEGTLRKNGEDWQKERQASAVVHQQLTEALQDRDAETERLAARVKAHEAEQLRLTSLLNEREVEHQRLTESLRARDAEHQRLSERLKQNEQERQQAFDSLKQRDDERERYAEQLVRQHESERAQLQAAIDLQKAEEMRLVQAIEQQKGEQQRLADLLARQDIEHQAAVEALQQNIVEFERALNSNDEAWKLRCDELAAELAAKDEEKRQRWEELSAQVARHAAEERRLAELLELSGAEQKRLLDEYAAEKIRIEQTVRGECDRVLAGVEDQRRREIESLRTDLAGLVEDLHGAATALERREEEYDRLMEAATAPRDPGEIVDPAHVERLMQSVAAYRIELVQVTENTIRTLEPMATAGRVAIAASRELQEAVAAVDLRSRQLLAQCALEDVNRPEIENLRRDAIAAASLVRQLLQAFGDPVRAGAGDTSLGATL